MIVTLVTMVITNIIIMILIRRIYINWSLLFSDPGVLHNWFHFPSHLFQELHNLLSIEGYKSVQKISTMIFSTIPFQNSFNYYYRTRVRSLASLVTHSVTNSLLFSELDGFEWCQLIDNVATATERFLRWKEALQAVYSWLRLSNSWLWRAEILNMKFDQDFYLYLWYDP